MPVLPEAALTALLDAKAQGLAVARPALATTNVADIMDAIRKSMAEATTGNRRVRKTS